LLKAIQTKLTKVQSREGTKDKQQGILKDCQVEFDKYLRHYAPQSDKLKK